MGTFINEYAGGRDFPPPRFPFSERFSSPATAAGARRDAAHTLFVYCLLVYNYTSTTYVKRRINTTTHATYVTHNSLISLCYFRDGYVNRTPKLSDAHASTLFLPAFTPMILKFVLLSNECGLRTQTFDNHFCI